MHTNDFASRKYLVTGASGFIGRALCLRLLTMGANVVGASRQPLDLAFDRWKHVAIDLTSPDDVDQLLEEFRPDYVIHLASFVTGKREVKWVRATIANNLLTAVNVLVAADGSGVQKVILAGSLEEPDRNDAAPIAASPYAASKWCASAYARMMFALYGTRSAIARIFMVYGPGQHDMEKFIPYVCSSAARCEAPKLMSGERMIDWIYIDDVVDALMRMSIAGPTDGSYVDIGSGELRATGDIARRICDIAGNDVEPIFGAVPDRAMEQVRKARIVATDELLDWRPRVSLEIGLKKTYDWYKQFVD